MSQNGSDDRVSESFLEQLTRTLVSIPRSVPSVLFAPSNRFGRDHATGLVTSAQAGLNDWSNELNERNEWKRTRGFLSRDRCASLCARAQIGEHYPHKSPKTLLLELPRGALVH